MSNPPSGQPYPPDQYGGYPPPPDHLPQTRRPGTVIAGSIMCWVGAVFGVFIGLVMAAVSSDEKFRSDLAIGPDDADQIRLLALGLAVWCVFVAVFALFAFFRRYWAVIVLAVMAGIYTVVFVIGAVNQGEATGLVAVIYAWVAVGLLFGGSKAWYSSA